MKNYLCSIILALVLISFGSITNAHAQCPTGYTPVTQTYGPDANGCYWDVSFCVRCSIVGGIPTSIIITDIVPNDKTSGCQQPNKNAILDFIREDINSYCTIIPCGDPQIPCSTTSSVTIFYPLCWQWHILGIDSDGYHFYKWKQPCTTGYCQISYKACIDHNSGLIVVCPGSSITYTEVDVTCSSVTISEPPDPSPPGPGNLGDHTYGNCFVDETCP